MGWLFSIVNNKPSFWLGFFTSIGISLPSILSAQNNDFDVGSISPTIGITWRSTIMNYFNFGPILTSDNSMSYSYERNVQGFSVNPGIQYKISNSVSLEYYPNFRYDVTHTTWRKKDFKIIYADAEDTVRVNNNPIYAKSFLLDHNFNVIGHIGKFDLGIGSTIVNFAKVINYKTNSYYSNATRNQNIQFTSINALIALPIKKVFKLEFKALYIPNGFPKNPYEKYMMYSIRAYYRFEKRNVVERRNKR